MREPLVLAVAQPECVAHDVEANARAHAALVCDASARVVVFPELSLTGYEFDAEPVAVDDARLSPLVEACAATGTVALAGAVVAGDVGHEPDGGQPDGAEVGATDRRPRSDGVRHIGVLAVDGEGGRVAYRKMYLGGAEAARFAPGPGPAVVEVDGWRLGLAVCKDTGVAEHATATADMGIDAYVAGVLDQVENAEVIVERARRIATTHRVWVPIASFAGSTGEGYDRAAGRSGVWAPDGSEVARAGPEVGAIARATLI